MEKWIVWQLDVLGNEYDGYDVNDRRRCGRVELPPEATDDQVVSALIEQDFLASNTSAIVSDGSDDCWIYLEQAATGCPLLQLTKDE